MPDSSYDLIIEGGTLIDGSGAPRRNADIGILGDRIAGVGDLKHAATLERLNATDRVVAVD